MNYLSAEELSSRKSNWCATLGVREDELQSFTAPALLILDMQNDFVGDEARLPVWGGPAVIPRVASLLRAFRSADRPVFFTRHVCIRPEPKPITLGVFSRVRDPDNLLREELAGSKIVSALQPRDGEYIVTKHHYSGFFGTPLEILLRSHSADEVVITGVVTNVCCEATAHDAFFRGFRVVFAMDGTGAFDEPAHLATLRTIQMSYGRLATVAQVRDTVCRQGAAQ